MNPNENIIENLKENVSGGKYITNPEQMRYDIDNAHAIQDAVNRITSIEGDAGKYVFNKVVKNLYGYLYGDECDYDFISEKFGDWPKGSLRELLVALQASQEVKKEKS